MNIESPHFNRTVQTEDIALLQKAAARGALGPQVLRSGLRIDPIEVSRLPRVPIEGFEVAHGIDRQTVENILTELPPRLVGEIESIHYVDSVDEDFAIGRTRAKPNSPDKAQIEMFKHPMYEFEESELRQPYKEAFVHEVGHVLFERLTTRMQRFQWGQMFNKTLRDGEKFISKYAERSLREDFGESFMTYITKPRKLHENQKNRYDFIDSLYKEIAQ